jgi:hypothetical protein
MIFLRNQFLDWNDLSLAMQLAVDDVWAQYGIDAMRCFCAGA